MIRYASFGRRLWAFTLAVLIDLLVYGALEAYTQGADVTAPFLFWLLLHHVGLVCEGGDLGHRLAGLRVVRLDGGRVDVIHAILREIVLVFLSIPPLGLGVLWMLDEPQRRTWHDLVGGTVVVRELTTEPHLVPDWAEDPPWRRPAAPKQAESPAAVPPATTPPADPA